ncbi:MAG TPA: hypothetical protein VIT68_02570, partial [Candidatus Gracilibacteria bacterium]
NDYNNYLKYNTQLRAAQQNLKDIEVYETQLRTTLHDTQNEFNDLQAALGRETTKFARYDNLLTAYNQQRTAYDKRKEEITKSVTEKYAYLASKGREYYEAGKQAAVENKSITEVVEEQLKKDQKVTVIPAREEIVIETREVPKDLYELKDLVASSGTGVGSGQSTVSTKSVSIKHLLEGAAGIGLEKAQTHFSDFSENHFQLWLKDNWIVPQSEESMRRHYIESVLLTGKAYEWKGSLITNEALKNSIWNSPSIQKLIFLKHDPATIKYIEDTIDMVLLGNYSEARATGAGVIGSIVLGIIGIDLPMDVRDLTHDLTNWEWSWSHAGKTALDGVGLLPLIGAVKNLKYLDEGAALSKAADDVIAANAKHLDDSVEVVLSDGSRIQVQKATLNGAGAGDDIATIIGRELADVRDNFMAKMQKNSEQGTNFVIDPDEIMESFPSFKYENMEMGYVGAAGKIASDLFQKALKEGGYDKVVFAAGGSASGKSEVLVKAFQGSKTLVIDGTFSNAGSLSKLKDALASGKSVEINAVFTDIDSAKIFNSRRARTVPEDVLIRTHKNFRLNMLEVAKKYPNLKISVVENGLEYKKAIDKTFKSQEALIKYLEESIIK